MSKSVPQMSLTAKIMRNEGRAFRTSPIFKDLEKYPDDDRLGGSGKDKDKLSLMSKNEFDEKLDDLKEKDDEFKKKRKSKRDPSIDEIRKQIQNMVFYFEKKKEKDFPTAYPLPGAAGDDSDDNGEGGNSKDKPNSYAEDRKASKSQSNNNKRKRQSANSKSASTSKRKRKS